MSSSKRRKLNTEVDTKNISAFAARQQRKLAISAPATGGVTGKAQKIVAEQSDVLHTGPSFVEAGKTSRLFRLGLDGGGTAKTEEGEYSDSSPYEGRDDAEDGSTGEKSRGTNTPSQQPLVQFTTVKARGDRIIREGLGSIRVKLAPGERVVVLGEYGLSVVKGRVTILGATLPHSGTVHRVYALSSHSLPVIRYLESDDNEVIIVLSQLRAGLKALGKLSPLFSKLWNESATILDGETASDEKTTFQILFSSADGPRKIPLHKVYSPPEWNETFAAVSSDRLKRGSISSTMICGPKSSGKSTFAKLLVNRLLTSSTTPPRPASKMAKKRPPGGVLILDLDPGQPEYSPPGQLSLVHLTKPNFGPPYTHPDANCSGCTVIRAHSVCAISPSTDSDHYMACVSNLLNHHRHYIALNAECPLIINTPGWILGTGLELLLELIKQAKPTVVIYMSTEGPTDVVKSLRNEARQTPVIELPSQISEYTTRTAAQLRVMQTMSYFHLDPLSQPLVSWKPAPLTSVPPWMVSYANPPGSGVFGVMCIGEQPAPEFLNDAINGCVVAVVLVDDALAIHGSPSDSDGEPGHCKGIDGEESPMSGEDLAKACNTTEDHLRYLKPGPTGYPDPKHCHSIGFALVRGIDTKAKCLQLLTPISPKVIRELEHSDSMVTLVSGKLETPGWAYTEELHRRAVAALSLRRKESGEAVDDEGSSGDESGVGEEGMEGFEKIPWVERLEGHRGRGVGERVWRVRRDLGRSGEGG